MIQVDFKKKFYRISPVPRGDAVVNVQCIRSFGIDMAPITARLDTVGDNTWYPLPRPAGGGDFSDGLYRVSLFSNGQLVNSVEGYMGLQRKLDIRTHVQKNGVGFRLVTGFPVNVGGNHQADSNMRIENKYDMCIRYANGITVPLPQAVNSSGGRGYVIDVLLPRANQGVSLFINKVFRDVVSVEVDGKARNLTDGQVRIF